MYMRMRTKCWYSGKPVRPRKDDRTNLNLRKDICHKRHSTVSQIRDWHMSKREKKGCTCEFACIYLQKAHKSKLNYRWIQGEKMNLGRIFLSAHFASLPNGHPKPKKHSQTADYTI